MESSFLELRSKEVINVVDGKKLGHICDLVFDLQTGQILGIIVPGCSGINLFKKNCELCIAYNQILKIGEDTILVEIPINLKECSAPPHIPYILNKTK